MHILDWYNIEKQQRYGDVWSDLGLSDPSSLIEEIVVTSTVSPEVRIPSPLKPAPSDQPSLLMQTIKPKLAIKVRGVSDPIVAAPWGEPTKSYWPVVWASSVVGAGFLVYFIGRGVWSLFKKK
jgi:hypothetical protein